MNAEDEYGMFPELPIEPVEEFKPETTCSKCSSIIAVKFSSNLFFCTAKKGGDYGKKIKKSEPNCPLFIEGKGLIPLTCGYYGWPKEGLRR